MTFFEMSKNPSNDNLNWIFSFENTSSVQKIYFPGKNREKCTILRSFCEKIKPTPPPKSAFIFPLGKWRLILRSCARCVQILYFFVTGRGKVQFNRVSNRFWIRLFLVKKSRFLQKMHEKLHAENGGVGFELKSNRYLGFVLKRTKILENPAGKKGKSEKY